MCKKGDIILISEYKHGDTSVSQHSFIVIDDQGGQVCGLSYDIVALVMSSFKNEEQRQRKLSYPGNFEITSADKNMADWANDKDGFVKAEQFYYFNKSQIRYAVIGSLTAEVWNLLVAFIEDLAERGVQIQQIIDNL